MDLYRTGMAARSTGPTRYRCQPSAAESPVHRTFFDVRASGV